MIYMAWLSIDGRRLVGPVYKWIFILVPRNISLCLNVSQHVCMMPGRSEPPHCLWCINCGSGSCSGEGEGFWPGVGVLHLVDYTG